MYIAKPSVELIGLLFPVKLDESGQVELRGNPEVLIEEAGRTCYKSEDKICPGSSTEFIKKIRKLQHESVLEHSGATFRIICDRGVSHEIEDILKKVAPTVFERAE